MSWDSDTAQTRDDSAPASPPTLIHVRRLPMSCIVRKYGGTCFADRDCLLRVARQVQAGSELPAVIVDPSRARAAGWTPRYATIEDGLPGVWEEWSVIDLDSVAAGVGAVGAPR